jgi:hypothetical protein
LGGGGGGASTGWVSSGGGGGGAPIGWVSIPGDGAVVQPATTAVNPMIMNAVTNLFITILPI